MVLGLMDFLLGGKRKTKVARNAQVATPNAQTPNTGGAQVPDGVNQPTQNATQDMQFEDQSQKGGASAQQQGAQQAATGQQGVQQARPAAQQQGGVQVPRKSVSEALSKLHKELKETNSRITDMVSSIKNVENNVNSLGHRIDDLEASKKETSEKFSEIDTSLSKFLSLYELINNQYNPFVTQDEAAVKKVVLDAQGNSSEESSSQVNAAEAIKALPDAIPELKDVKKVNLDDLESTLLELDTLDIEEAAADAVPLTKLKNNTNSLVVILSWLEYLTKRVGIEETRNSLRYYTEVLRWITPEVFFDLDKYLRGMTDKKEHDQETLGVRDHIVSLYFISKLNEKTLDAKLTKAVLQIIKA